MNTNEEKERKDFLVQWKKIKGVHPLAECSVGADGKFLNERCEQDWKLWQAGRAALRAESEPVAWRWKVKHGEWHLAMRNPTEFVGISEIQPLYTAPQTELKDTGSEIVPAESDAVLTPDILASALDYFWNGALGNLQQSMAETSEAHETVQAIVAGVQAVADGLRAQSAASKGEQSND